MQKTDGIFFDLGWTLVRPSSGHWLYAEQAKERLTAALGTPRAAEDVMEKHWRAILDNHQLWLTEQEERDAFFEMYRRTSAELGLGWDHNTLAAFADEQVYSDAYYLVYDGVHELLGRLGERYRLGVISDTQPSICRRLYNLGLSRYFSSFTFSCFLGVGKPNPAMFRHALLASGLDGERCVFIDDLEKNLHAAAAFGMRGVQICAGAHVVPSETYPTIADIRDIEGLV